MQPGFLDLGYPLSFITVHTRQRRIGLLYVLWFYCLRLRLTVSSHFSARHCVLYAHQFHSFVYLANWFIGLKQLPLFLPNHIITSSKSRYFLGLLLLYILQDCAICSGSTCDERAN